MPWSARLSASIHQFRLVPVLRERHRRHKSGIDDGSIFGVERLGQREEQRALVGIRSRRREGRLPVTRPAGTGTGRSSGSGSLQIGDVARDRDLPDIAQRAVAERSSRPGDS
jgi:hypothetical protein